MKTQYQLLDSGDGYKLERFGDRILARPSTLCVWNRRQQPKIWNNADATLLQKGQWRFKGAAFKSWVAPFDGVRLELRLNDNGQIGVFPVHESYLKNIRSSVKELLSTSHSKKLRILNLFAYTGLATLACLIFNRSESIEVTHVDLVKRAIDWAKHNAAINGLEKNNIRWIVDDAIAFMLREARRNQSYDLIIIDPPSFSRISKKNSWMLEDKLPEILKLTLNLLNTSDGSIFFSNHSSVNTLDIARNLILDHFVERGSSVQIDSKSLFIPEAVTGRNLPSGALISMHLRTNI